ncbi:hypothetical protein [Streptomyces sp. NPDC090022]|uniref:hypothetical protein n=1 Tax=Streptomyces sp. NPDC090022 TaxID=3365920 RepID=UPI00381DE04A
MPGITTIRTLTPQAGRIDTAALRTYDADRLARCAADRGQPWWRRTACVDALAGRVPPGRIGSLLACVRDTGDVAEVRRALLGLLADREELLPWLRHEDRRHDGAYGMTEAVLRARGALGDLTAAGELATVAFSPWQHRRTAGEAGLDALVDRHGTAAVRAALDGDRPEDRACVVRLRRRADEDVTDALADPDPRVAHLAQSLTADPAALRGYLDRAPTADAKLWAAYALHRLTGDTAAVRAVYEALGRPRVEVEGLDEEVRRAIVHTYGPGCEAGSDPRWRIEALCTPPPEPFDEDGQLRRAVAALAAAGLSPGPPVSCGDHHQQGGGTYHVIAYRDPDDGAGDGERGAPATVFISTLGPFAGDYEDAPAARAALEAAGLRWIDATAGSVRVTGLGVYHFGERGPLDVHTLLFYWQD